MQLTVSNTNYLFLKLKAGEKYQVAPAPVRPWEIRPPLAPRGRPHTYKFILPSVNWKRREVNKVFSVLRFYLIQPHFHLA